MTTDNCMYVTLCSDFSDNFYIFSMFNKIKIYNAQKIIITKEFFLVVIVKFANTQAN